MLDKDIVLEALGVVCNAKVTSFQKQSSEAGGDFCLQAGSPAFQHLSLSDSAKQTQLFLKQLICTVADGDKTCPMARSTLAAIRRDLYGIPPANFVSFCSDQSGAVSAAVVTGPNVHVKLAVGEENGKIIIDEDEFFDPRFNYDFTGLKDTKTYYRGGEKYGRPCGWQRFALKVLDKYDGNEWLGTTGRSTESVPGEWPVSYHGTSEDGAEGIMKEYYKPGSRNVYGTGIYSSPDINVALGYCKEFTSKKNGKTYKVILQNRINPKYTKKFRKNKDYWLVEIDDNLSKEEKEKMAERAIRPYGLLLKEF